MRTLTDKSGQCQIYFSYLCSDRKNKDMPIPKEFLGEVLGMRSFNL